MLATCECGYEMIRLSSGEGAWHPTFSGLTSPLLNWAQSLFKDGTVTTGLACLLREKTIDENGNVRLSLLHQGEARQFQFWYVSKQPPLACYAIACEDILSGLRQVDILLEMNSSHNEAFVNTNIVTCEMNRLDENLFMVSVFYPVE